MRRREENLSFVELAVWLVIGGSFALPGLLPAIQLTAQSTAEEIREANVTYTFRRLAHHLVFYRFAHWNPLAANFNVVRPISFAIVVAAWFWLVRIHPTNERMQRLKSIVLGSLLIAAAGIALDVLLGPFPYTRAGLLRYYWFRLSDILVPAGIALVAVKLLETPRRLPRTVVFGAVVVAALAIGQMIPQTGFAARSMSLQQQNWRVFDEGTDLDEVDAAWLDVCEWIRDENNIPPGSVFLTPTRQQTFKWLAQRPDVVTWKDVPQDARGLNAWWERRKAVYKLGQWPWDDADLCANLLESYDVTHVVWPATANSSMQPVPDHVTQLYRNDLFRVFAVQDTD